MFHRILSLESSSHEEMIELTAQVEQVIRESEQRNGMVTIFVPHTTAAVTINENADHDVQTDMIAWLRRLVPADPSFRHAEGNSDGHIKASLVGLTAQVPLVDGRLRLGTWQGIYFCEFDGPRRRQFEVLVG